MKKLFIFIAACLLMMCTLCGCSSLFGSSPSQNSSSSSSNTEITVYNDEIPVKFTVKYGSQAKVTSFTKQDSYLKGYYTESTNGQQYFDTDGKSLSVWQQGNPDTFYAQWGDISELSFSDSDEGGSYGQLMVNYCYFTSKFSPEMLNGIKGNLNRKLNFNVRFDARDSANVHMSQIYISNSTESGRIKYKLGSDIELSTNWKNLNYSVNISADEFSGGNFHIYFVTDQNRTNAHQFLRNIQVSVTFA